MLSRVAENLYWMARYVERAEGCARLINVTTHILLDAPDDIALGWYPLVTISGQEALYNRLHETSDEATVIDFLVRELQNPSSIVNSIHHARENLRTTRDIMPISLWEELNHLHYNLQRSIGQASNPALRSAFLHKLIRQCQTLTGIIEGTLSRSTGFRFIQLGRQIERADITSRVMNVPAANVLGRTADNLSPFQQLQWLSVLKSLTAYHMYRQFVRVRVRGFDVLEFLVRNPELPRSVYAAMSTLEAQVVQLPRHDRVLALCAYCKAELTEVDVEQLANHPARLSGFVDTLQQHLIAIDQAIYQAYFTVSHYESALITSDE